MEYKDKRLVAFVEGAYGKEMVTIVSYSKGSIFDEVIKDKEEK